jgi:hypothetical protein
MSAGTANNNTHPRAMGEPKGERAAAKSRANEKPADGAPTDPSLPCQASSRAEATIETDRHANPRRHQS